MKPMIVRNVHYVPSHGSKEHCAAIICAVLGGDVVNLVTFGATGIPCPQLNVPQDPRGLLGHSWHWPERDDTDL